MKINAGSRTRFYNAGDYLFQGAHLAVAGALAVATAFWVGPLVLLGSAAAAGALVGGVTLISDKLMGKMFIKHAIDLEKQKGLASVVPAFTLKAGLAKEPEIFDFQINREELKNKKDDSLSTLPQLKRIFNAFAGGIKNPIIVISEPVLNAMTPQETEAIAGHEFTHLGARHLVSRSLSSWLQMTTMLSGMFILGGAVVSQGWTLGLASMAGVIAVSYAGNKLMPKNEDRYTRDGQMRPGVQRTQWAVWAAQETISVGLLAVLNPIPVLTAFTIEHGFFWAANVTNRSFSRRQEFQADRGAVMMGSDPLALITSLRKLQRSLELNEPALAQSLDWRSGPFYARFFKMGSSLLKTHPDTERRCRRLAAMAAAQGRSEDEIALALNSPLDEAPLILPKVEEAEKAPQPSDKNRAKKILQALFNRKVRGESEAIAEARQVHTENPPPEQFKL